MAKQYSGSTPEERGKGAEEKFFKAWENENYFPKWMVSVERPTLYEDLLQKTDAVIICIQGPNLRIQIKSYRLTCEERHALLEYGVIPISVTCRDSLEQIRRLTHKAVDIFKNFTSTAPHKFTTVAPKKDRVYFFRGGKKYISNKLHKSP